MVRIKKKIKIPAGANDENITEMFNQMLGAGTVNMTIAYPRYKRIHVLCSGLLDLCDIIAKGPPMVKLPQFNNDRIDIINFIEKSRELMKSIFSADLTDYEHTLNNITDSMKTSFLTVYEESKKSTIVNTFLITCSRLVPYEYSIKDMNKLDYKFIVLMPGVEWKPFAFSNLNYKDIFIMPDATQATKSFFMVVLARMFELTSQLYKEVSSPDVDVEQFAEMIVTNIDKIQSQPELSRCTRAFQKIKDSITLLKNRFNGYYRDFIDTQDPTIMMQHFILDVSKETTADPQLTLEFRKIVTYYRKLAANQISNPKVKLLFEKVSESFKDLEKGTSGLSKINKQELTNESTAQSNENFTIDTSAKTENDITDMKT